MVFKNLGKQSLPCSQYVYAGKSIPDFWQVG